jgi:hypothetical protein
VRVRDITCAVGPNGEHSRLEEPCRDEDETTVAVNKYDQKSFRLNLGGHAKIG